MSPDLPAATDRPDAAASEAVRTPPKVDPASLVLRGRPHRPVRFRRGLVISLVASAALAVAATAWFALRPAALRLALGSDEPFEPRDARPPEVLANAPGRYDEIPQLGPPLPGDLGRGILDRQRRIKAAGADEPTEAEAATRERAFAARAEARQSSVLTGLGAGTLKAGDPGEEEPVSPLDAAPPGVAPQSAAPHLAGASAERIEPPASRWILSGGSVIAASLLTGLNSDVPGTVVAQVTQNTYDSITGRTLLIPQGARLIGRFESQVAFGQRRAFVAWQRLVWPDGTSLALDELPASDASGEAGLADRVDVHTGQLLKGVALSTLLGVGTQLSLGSGGSGLVRALREAVQEGGARAGDRLVGKSLDVAPTITVRPGWPLRVLVARDLVLAPWRP